MLPIIAGVVSSLLANGLPKVAQAVVDKGIGYVEDKLGIKIEAEEDKPLSPEQITQIRIASLKHEEFMEEQVTKRTELVYKGVEDARALQRLALTQEDMFSKRFVYYFSAFWSVVCAMYIFCITFATIPTANVRIVDTVSGFILGTALAGMFTYFLGSSIGSARKDRMLELKEQEAKDASNAAK